MNPSVLPPPAASASRVAPVFLPREHGSWSLALEPLALGLLVAPSWAGGALAAAVLSGFFARRPLKAALDRANPVKRMAAREAFTLWAALAVAGLSEAGVLGGWAGLWPLLAAAPLGALFVWFDTRNSSRAAAAELAGSAAFALVPAAVATLAHRSVTVALALTCLAAARSIPTILTVRTFLRSAKGEETTATQALVASIMAFGAVSALVALGVVPWIAAALAALLFARALWLTGPRRPAWTARRIGQAEAAFGLLYIVLIAANWPST